MTPLTTPKKLIIYLRIYKSYNDRFIIYTGITRDMKRRQLEHLTGLCRTTNRYNKSYKLIEIRYKEYEELSFLMLEELENKFKKMKLIDKIRISDLWERWVG